jgi:hypothetical protein
VTASDYQRRLLDAWRHLPFTAGSRPSRQDRTLASALWRDRVPLPLLLLALRLAAQRRLQRATALPPLLPVRSLHYILPVLHELQLAKPDYLDYLEHSLPPLPYTPTAAVQIPEVSHDR